MRGIDLTTEELDTVVSIVVDLNIVDFRAGTDGFQQAFFADPFQNFAPQQLLDYAFAEPLKFSPGQGFQYSNTNTVLLGLVVEKISGQSLPDYIRDHITVPLALSHTSFPTTNA